jgi:hypothetical protein
MDCIWLEEERDDADNYMLELVDLMLEDRQGGRSDKFWKMEITERRMPGKRGDHLLKNRTLHEEDGPATSVLMSREVEVGSRVKSIAEASAYKIESK